MAQAKGVLPTKGDDREVLYKNPRTCGYFVGVQLAAGQSPDQLEQWLTSLSAAVDALVARGDPSIKQPEGEKFASVAVGLAARFFDTLNASGEVAETPVGLRPDAAPTSGGWFPEISLLNVDAMLYVSSVLETRVNEFLLTLQASPHVAGLTLDRGYQTSDETEPFGYKDGVRNVRSSQRSDVVFVDTAQGQPDEPHWADGGTYMVTMKIIQNRETFQALPDDAARDNVIGRTKDGLRLDLRDQAIDPHDEPVDVPHALPASSHVRKVGPRGEHDDTQIFRRGLPFMEVVEGQLQMGLQFCSFQANPDQFDTVFNDWMTNPHFPSGAGAGPDALLAGSFVQFVHAGLFFVLPQHENGFAGALKKKHRRPPTTGRLVINKRVTDPADPTKRLERRGFVFKVQHQDGTPVPGSDFTTASTGRGVCPADLEIGKTYTLVEVSAPHPVVPSNTDFTVHKPNEHLTVQNQLTQSGGPYGGTA